MAVWAEAMRTLNNADEKTDLNLVLKVINEIIQFLLSFSTHKEMHRFSVMSHSVELILMTA